MDSDEDDNWNWNAKKSTSKTKTKEKKSSKKASRTDSKTPGSLNSQQPPRKSLQPPPQFQSHQPQMPPPQLHSQQQPPERETRPQLRQETTRKVSEEPDVRRLSSIVDEPDEDLGASLWKRGKRTLDIQFKFSHEDPAAPPLVCHSLIISHWSSVLSIMVEKAKASGRRNENGQAVIEIDNKDFRRSDFDILVRYLYFRDVNVDKMTPLRRRRLIALSRAYHVPGLERSCKKFLQYPLCANNVYLYLDEAFDKDDEALKRKCLEIIRMNRGCFAPDIEYFDISQEIMLEIVSLQQLPVTEQELFTFFHKWYEATKDGDISTEEGQTSFTFINQNNNIPRANNWNNNANTDAAVLPGPHTTIKVRDGNADNARKQDDGDNFNNYNDVDKVNDDDDDDHHKLDGQR